MALVKFLAAATPPYTRNERVLRGALPRGGSPLHEYTTIDKIFARARVNLHVRYIILV